MSEYVAGRWAIANVTGTNRTDEDQVVTSVVTLGNQDGLQYAREVWVPANAQRRASLPVKVPDTLGRSQIQIQFKSSQISEGPAGEKRQANAVGMAQSKRALLLSWDESRTGILLDNTEVDSLRSGDESDQRRANQELEVEKIFNVVGAARDSRGDVNRDSGVVSLQGAASPLTSLGLDCIDQIVVAGDDFSKDSGAAESIQRWVQNGGKLWVMVDRLSQPTIDRLVGGLRSFEIVDRVPLNSFQTQPSETSTQRAMLQAESWAADEPVLMARVIRDPVLSENEELVASIDGWPAALWKPVGEGEILFTMLGAEGWLDQGQASQALRLVATRFFDSKLDQVSRTSGMRPMLNQVIGYEIPSKASIAIVLLTHLIILLIAGIVLLRRKALQHFASALIATSLLSGLLVFVLGKRKTTAVPDTIATGQIVRAISGSPHLSIESTSAIYSSRSRSLDISSEYGTITEFPNLDVAGETKRLLWDDSANSQWMFVDQPPGVVQHFKTNAVTTPSSPMLVSGSFDENGFKGKWFGVGEETFEDAVVVSKAMPSAKADFVSGSGELISRADDLLPPNRFIATELVEDRQRERQALLQGWVQDDKTLFTTAPSLFAWGKPVDAGQSLDGVFEERGFALHIIPIDLQAPELGQRFVVPASFVRLEPIAGDDGVVSLFNAETGRWVENVSRPADIAIRCLLPKPLLPCQLDRATVRMKIKAPSRSLLVQAMDGEKRKTVFELANPVGIVETKIQDARLLQVDDRGGVRISISVTETEQEEQSSTNDRRRLGGQVKPPSSFLPGTDTPIDATQVPDLPSRSSWQIDFLQIEFEGRFTD
ncbi:MAG: hypothetical protein AAF664_19920 [Planctomycetota bacterium]